MPESGHKKIQKYKKKSWIRSICSKFRTDDRFAGLFSGTSALLQYYSEFRTRSQKFIIVPILQELSLYVFVFLQCTS